MQTWHVYIVCCADNTLYCGITTDMARRMAEHNGLKRGGAKYTRARRPVSLCVCAPCQSRRAAAIVEAYIHKLPRHKKIATITYFAQHGTLPCKEKELLQ